MCVCVCVCVCACVRACVRACVLSLWSGGGGGREEGGRGSVKSTLHDVHDEDSNTSVSGLM